MPTAWALRLLEAIRILGLRPSAILSGIDIRAVREGPADPPDRDDTVSSAQPLRRCKALRILDHRELSRGLRHPRSNGILFNHEGPARETFVTRKITRAVAAMDVAGKRGCTWGTWAPRGIGVTRATRRHVEDVATSEPDDYVLRRVKGPLRAGVRGGSICMRGKNNRVERDRNQRDRKGGQVRT